MKSYFGNISSREYQDRLIKDNDKYKKEIRYLLNKDNLVIVDSKDEKMVNLLYDLKKKYKVYFLSNMIDITHDFLKDILNDFDGGVYSFEEHTKKPDEKFFMTLINRYNLDVKETIYFDDKIKNIEAARKLGIKAIKFETINDVLENIF